MLKIGLTGGIGSGKSTVSKVFETFGVPVYMADQRSKFLIETDSDLKKTLKREFGENTYTQHGYNTAYIAGIVFNNKDLLTKLNSIVHPYVADDFEKWYIAYEHKPYILQESAILFESGASVHIFVEAPESLRIKRVTERDRISEDDVRLRMQHQWHADKIRLLADWVIKNDDNTLLLPQLIKLHNNLLYICKVHGKIR